MRFLAGSSYDSVGAQELQRDSARDSRWFNSLQAQRALQDQVNNEAARRAQAEQQNYAQAIAQQQYSQQQRYNQQLLEADQGRQRQNFTLQTRQQNLLAERPDPRVMRFNEDQNADLLADQDTADAAQKYAALLEKRRELSNIKQSFVTLPDIYKKRANELTPWYKSDFGFQPNDEARQQASDELTNFSQYIPNLPFAKKTFKERIDLAKPVVESELAEVEARIKNYGRDLDQYVDEDAGGHFVSTFRPRGPVVPVAPPVAAPTAGQRLMPQPTNTPLRMTSPPVASAPDMPSIIAYAMKALGRGIPPEMVVQRAHEKFGLDITPYLK